MLSSASRASLAGAALGLALLCAAPLASAGPLPRGAVPTVGLSIASSHDGYSDLYEAQLGGSLNADERPYSVAGTSTRDSFVATWDLDVDPDPQIEGTLTVLSAIASLQDFVLTITLPTAAYAGPNLMGGSLGAVASTDLYFADGSARVATVGSDPFYSAIIDDTTVASLGSFDVPAAGGLGISGTISPETFGAPIPEAPAPALLASTGVRIHFALSGGDGVAIPFRFQVAPVPVAATLALFGVGLIATAALRRARR